MKKIHLLLGIVVILIAGAIWAISSNQEPTVTHDGPTVAATIFPLYDITQNIAGDALHVELLLPVGASPHTFEPSPSLIRNVEQSAVVYSIGHELDDWSQTIGDSINAEIVTVDEGIVLFESAHGDHHDEEEHDDHEEEGHDDDHDDEHEDEDDDHGHGELDPHYWLAFENARIMVGTIRDDLSARFPESADVFEQNAQTYLQQLADADEAARATVLADVENQNLITLHDAWYYFSNSFGFNIVGTFEPSAGREPSPQYLIELGEAIETTGTSVLYSEPQLDTQSLDAFVSDNNLSIAVLDPLGGTEQTATYIDLMLYNVQIIADNQ